MKWLVTEGVDISSLLQEGDSNGMGSFCEEIRTMFEGKVQCVNVCGVSSRGRP